MEHNTLQRRSAGTIKNMGINSYSQIVSAFRAQGDLTDDQLTILPVLQNALGISRERHTAEVKRALYDEKLSEIASSINSSSNTINWETEANYACPTIVHRPPNTEYVQTAEQILQTKLPTTIIQHPQPTTTIKLNRDLQKLVDDEIKQDGIINATQQQQQFNNTTKQNLINFNNTDIQNSKVVRLVRAKQATKRKTSLDTLIEVVQKELLRVNGQTTSISPSSSPPHYSQTRSLPSSKLQNRILQSNLSPHRSIISSSHPDSFKLARKRGLMNFNNNHPKRISSFQQRNKSFNNYHDDDFIDNNESIDDIQSASENIEEIVRDTVDKLVALTLLNTAPFVVNMLTAVPGNGTNTESQILVNNTSMIKSQSINSKSDHYRNDLDLRTSPIKQQQQQIHHPQLIIQPNSISTTPTLFVAPRILNFQTVVPKPTTNIQIGNTKIILVSPSNINKHLPHSTTNSQQQNRLNNNSVKLVKFNTTTTNNNNNNNNSLPTRTTTLPINTTQTSTLTLPKNVQIVIPSQTSSTIQLTRTHSDDSNKSLPITTTTTNTFRPITTVPVALTTCAVDQIPQAAQEVTITTSPTSSPLLQSNTSDLQQQQSSSSSLGTTVNVITSNSNNQSAIYGNSQQQYFLANSFENNNNNNILTVGKSRRHSSSSTSIDKPVGKILRTITKVLPATIVDNTNSISTIQQQQSVSNLRTSPSQESVTVNFQQQSQQIQRSSSTHGPMIYRMTSVNPNVPVFRVRATTAPTSSTVMNKSIKTDSKPISVTTTTNMCYESKSTTHNTSTPSGSVSVLACFKTTKKRNKERAIMPRPSINDSNDISIGNNLSLISNSSPDYNRQTSSSSIPTNLSSTLSDDNILNQEDTTNSIPISRNNNTIETILNHSLNPIMEDKSIQCINDDDENSNEIKKRSINDTEDNWIVKANCLFHDIISQSDYQYLDVNCQEILSLKLNLIQSNLINGILSTKDEFYQSILELKRQLIDDNSFKIFENNLEQIFNYFEMKLFDEINEHKRIRRQ